MKEHPILFSTPMVRAILDGRKSQTRRMIKSQPQKNDNPDRLGVFWWKGSHGWDERQLIPLCPYGQPGDILWVRETFLIEHVGDKICYDYKANYSNILADEVCWRPSIFMPKAACRIRLEITNIRVERLQDISEEDAIAEGIEPQGEGWKSYEIIHRGRHKGEMNPHSIIPNKSPITSYRELWESINGLGSWEKNPWVWVIEFKKSQ